MKCKCHFHEGFVPLAGLEENNSCILQSLRNFKHAFYIYVYFFPSIMVIIPQVQKQGSSSSSVPNCLWLLLRPSWRPSDFSPVIEDKAKLYYVFKKNIR